MKSIIILAITVLLGFAIAKPTPDIYMLNKNGAEIFNIFKSAKNSIVTSAQKSKKIFTISITGAKDYTLINFNRGASFVKSQFTPITSIFSFKPDDSPVNKFNRDAFPAVIDSNPDVPPVNNFNRDTDLTRIPSSPNTDLIWIPSNPNTGLTWIPSNPNPSSNLPNNYPNTDLTRIPSSPSLTPGQPNNGRSDFPVSTSTTRSVVTTTTPRPIPDSKEHDTDSTSTPKTESNEPKSVAENRTQEVSSICSCNQTVFRNIWSKINSNINKINSLEGEVYPLKEQIRVLNETLTELIDTANVGTQLQLMGNLPSQTNPADDVKHVLIEKLNLMDLSTSILQAIYLKDGIHFEVKTPLDKLRILKRSKDLLVNEKYKIVDANNFKKINENDQHNNMPIELESNGDSDTFASIEPRIGAK